MKPEKPEQAGSNKTGIKTRPEMAAQAAEAGRFKPSSEGNEKTANEMRSRYVQAAGPVGTLPAEAAGMHANGKPLNLFLDKLGERLAFERTGTRLYEAFIAKVEAAGDRSLPVEELEWIRGQEEKHFHLLHKVIENLYADPTVVTPSADIAGVASQGLLKVIADPRTTVAECLSALLTAELTDNDGWTLLSDLADKMGFQDEAGEFRKAEDEEQEHLRKIRSWLHQQLEQKLQIQKAAA